MKAYMIDEIILLNILWPALIHNIILLDGITANNNSLRNDDDDDN